MFTASSRLQKSIATTAIALSFVAYIPQVNQIIQSKSADDINYIFIILFMVAGLLWMVYAVSRGDFVMLVAYTAGFIMTSSILVLKMIYEKKNALKGTMSS